MANEKEIETHEPETNTDFVVIPPVETDDDRAIAELMEKNRQHMLEVLGISPALLETEMYSSIHHWHTLEEAGRKVNHSAWDTYEGLVGDEQGVLHPRAEKKKPRDVIIVGSGPSSFYARQLGRSLAGGLIAKEALRGVSDRIGHIDSYNFIDTAPSYARPESLTVRKKKSNQQQKIEAKNKQQRISRRKNRK